MAGAICGLIAVLRLRSIEHRLRNLERQSSRAQSTPTRSSTTRSSTTQSSTTQSSTTPFATSPPTPPATTEPESPDPTRDRTHDASAPIVSAVESVTEDEQTLFFSRIEQKVKDDWMIWLGGFCVALAGVFLAIYSIEQGLLGPKGRVILGVIIGGTLHAGAEYLRQRAGRSHPALAVTAGAGSITIFAALLSALHLYELTSPSLTFLCLAIVAIVTMWMAYLHGPMLAAFGILGAYLVPIMVSSGEGQVLVALTYSVIISTSALLLLRYVYRNWLWWGFVTGAIGWWAITIFDANAEGARGIYLAAIAYLILAIPNFNWFLTQTRTLPSENYDVRTYSSSGVNVSFSIVLLIVAQGTISVEADYSDAFFRWSFLPLITLLAARYQEPLNLLPWLIMIVTMVAWIAPQLSIDDGKLILELLDAPDDQSALFYLGVTAILFSGIALSNMLVCRYKALWASLGTLAPVLLLTLGYSLTQRFLVSWHWGILTAMLAVIYLALATASVRRKSLDSLVPWMFVGGHFALSLAAVMVLPETALTLAFAAQLVSTAWVIRQFELPNLGWLLKLLTAIVITRLTLNPWLAGYSTETHWSLWIYGGSTICCLISAYMTRAWPQLSKWAEGAALHLFVLTLWSEARYWLHDGVVFENDYTSLEAGIYVLLFASAAIVYHLRSLVSQNLQKLYELYSYVLVVMAIGNYAAILIATLYSAPWLKVGEAPILNMLLLYYGTPVGLCAIFYWFYQARFQATSMLFAAVTTFIFITMEIRHLWQESLRLDLPTSSGELYTYSVVWLIMAIAAILTGTWRYGRHCYQSGMLLLALVIAKIFLIDMSDLEGLLRVASFMGLGLALLAISYLHQRMQQRPN